MSVSELATMRAKEGRGDDLAAAFPEALNRATEVAEGSHGWSVLRCIERPDEFVVRIEWDSVEAHEAFRATPARDAFRDALAPALEELVGVAHYQDI